MKKINYNQLALGVWLILLTPPLLTGCATNTPTSSDNRAAYGIIGNNETELLQARNRFWAKVRPLNTIATAHYRLGRFQQKQGKHALALICFHKAIKANPHDIKSYNAMGISHDALGEPDAAQKAYEQAISLAPSLAYPHNNLGCSFLLRGDIDSAIASFVKAAELDDQTLKIKNNLAVALRKAQQRDLREEQQTLAKQRRQESGGEQKNNPLKKLRELIVSSDTFYEWEPVVSSISTAPGDNEFTGGQTLASATQRHAEPLAVSHSETREAVNEGAGADNAALAPVGGESAARQAQTGKAEERATGGKTLAQRVMPDSDPEAGRGENRLPLPASGMSPLAGASEQPAAVTTGESRPRIVARAVKIKKIKKFAAAAKAVTPERVTLHTLQNVALEVSNGNGVTGLARRTAQYFKSQGVKIRRVTNAENFNFTTTKIVYQKGYLAQAYQLARLIPGFQKLECLPTLNHPEIKVKLILGKDISMSAFAELAARGENKKTGPEV